jgi:hypothetical protein
MRRLILFAVTSFILALPAQAGLETGVPEPVVGVQPLVGVYLSRFPDGRPMFDCSCDEAPDTAPLGGMGDRDNPGGGGGGGGEPGSGRTPPPPPIDLNPHPVVPDPAQVRDLPPLPEVDPPTSDFKNEVLPFIKNRIYVPLQNAYRALHCNTDGSPKFGLNYDLPTHTLYICVGTASP